MPGGGRTLDDAVGFANRVRGGWTAPDLSVEAAAQGAGLPASRLRRVLDGPMPPRQGKPLLRLAEIPVTSVSCLVGPDPAAPVPEAWLAEDQGSFGLLAGDEEALLRAYRRPDVSSRSTLVQIVLKIAPQPDHDEREPRRTKPRQPDAAAQAGLERTHHLRPGAARGRLSHDGFVAAWLQATTSSDPAAGTPKPCARRPPSVATATRGTYAGHAAASRPSAQRLRQAGPLARPGLLCQATVRHSYRRNRHRHGDAALP